MYLYKYNKNSFENIKTDIKIGDFSYPDRILAGIQDFQAKSGKSQRDRDSWTVWVKLFISRSQIVLFLLHFPFKSFHSFLFIYLFLLNLFLIYTVHAFDVGLNFCGLSILQSSRIS